jgi:hypothetical protein
VEGVERSLTGPREEENRRRGHGEEDRRRGHREEDNAGGRAFPLSHDRGILCISLEKSFLENEILGKTFPKDFSLK